MVGIGDGALVGKGVGAIVGGRVGLSLGCVVGDEEDAVGLYQQRNGDQHDALWIADDSFRLEPEQQHDRCQQAYDRQWL